jgi:hypothetical protein
MHHPIKIHTSTLACHCDLPGQQQQQQQCLLTVGRKKGLLQCSTQTVALLGSPLSILSDSRAVTDSQLTKE